MEVDNILLENKKLKDQLNLIPSLKAEIENLKIQMRKNSFEFENLNSEVIKKETLILSLEKKISIFKNDLMEKESELQLANNECNMTKHYEKKKDILHSTLLDIRELKDKISNDKNNLTIAFNSTIGNCNNISDNYNYNYNYNLNENENINGNSINNINLSNTNNCTGDYFMNYVNTNLSNLNIIDGKNNNNHNLNLNKDKERILNNQNNNININSNNNKNTKNLNFPNVISTPRSEGPESYRKITEDDVYFYNSTIRSFDLSLLAEFDFILNKRIWFLLLNWLNFSNKNANIGIGDKKTTLNLLFKASRDGYSHLDFREKCIGIQNTLIIALTNHDQIIGGFTPLSWENSDEYCYVKDESETSFLFNATRPEKMKLINSDHAICLSPDSGPIFGGGSDFEIVDNCDTEFNKFHRIGHSYQYDDVPENFFGSKRYLIRDYEVYEVIDI